MESLLLGLLAGLVVGCSDEPTTPIALPAVAANVYCAGMTPLRTVNVSTMSQLVAAKNNALPGDCIILAAGTYAPTAN